LLLYKDNTFGFFDILPIKIREILFSGEPIDKYYIGSLLGDRLALNQKLRCLVERSLALQKYCDRTVISSSGMYLSDRVINQVLALVGE